MPQQLSLLDALEKRDAALSRVAPSFTARAIEQILAVLAVGETMSGEELVNRCKEAGVKPEDDRAFGGAFHSLRHRGVLVEAGTCLRVKGNGTKGGTIYRRAK